MALRGSSLRNTSFAIGIVVYTGMNTKIMKNHKKPRFKVSNIMRLMNNMLYTVFAFQFTIVMLMAGLNTDWVKRNGDNHDYLNIVMISIHFYLSLNSHTVLPIYLYLTIIGSI
jgi:magnesium-transporting ATPase (P-type)